MEKQALPIPEIEAQAALLQGLCEFPQRRMANAAAAPHDSGIPKGGGPWATLFPLFLFAQKKGPAEHVLFPPAGETIPTARRAAISRRGQGGVNKGSQPLGDSFPLFSVRTEKRACGAVPSPSQGRNRLLAPAGAEPTPPGRFLF